MGRTMASEHGEGDEIDQMIDYKRVGSIQRSPYGLYD